MRRSSTREGKVPPRRRMPLEASAIRLGWRDVSYDTIGQVLPAPAHGGRWHIRKTGASKPHAAID